MQHFRKRYSRAFIAHDPKLPDTVHTTTGCHSGSARYNPSKKRMLRVVGRNFNEAFEQARMLVQGPGLVASRALLQINYNEPASAWLSLFVYSFILVSTAPGAFRDE